MNEFKPGQIVWIVERDENGVVEAVSDVMYFASVADAVIVSILVEDFTRHCVCDLADTIEYRIEKTQENGTAELYIYPAKDCFGTREDAQAAFDADMVMGE